MSGETPRRTSGAWRSVLTLSAVVLAVVLVGRIGDTIAQTGSSAGDGAGMVTQLDNYCLLATESSGDSMVAVIDGRAEALMIYKLDQGNAIQLVQRISIPRLFIDARARYQGRN